MKGILCIAVVFGALACYAQNIGINNTGTAANSSAILDISGSNKGLLIPRLSAAQRSAIASPATGLLIYDVSANQLEYWNGSSWIQLSNTVLTAINGAGTNTGISVTISNTASPADPSAILDIQSATGGILLPRMSDTQRDAISAPVTGLLIYNITTQLINFYSSSGWQQLCGTSISSATGSVTTPANVGINTSTPDPSAMLDVTSVTAGVAIPRLSTAQRNAILSPAQGLMLFNITTQTINVYNGTGNWLNFAVQTAPVAPTAGTNTPAQTQITWNWNTVSGASGYRYNTTNNYGTSIDNGTSASYTQTGLLCNIADTLYVWAYNCGGNSPAVTLTQTTSDCVTGGACAGATTMTDARDGQIYNIVQIGSQCWFQQNLNYGTQVSVGQAQSSNQKYCYGDAASNCTIYGGLYQWADMMNSSAGCNGTGHAQPGCSTPVQGLCPAGWHVPTHYEWTMLERNVGTDSSAFPYDITTLYSLGVDEGHNLLSTSVIDGTNSSGFNAILGGQSNGGYALLDATGYFWTATGFDATQAWFRSLNAYLGVVYRDGDPKTLGKSVRCLKN